MWRFLASTTMEVTLPSYGSIHAVVSQYRISSLKGLKPVKPISVGRGFANATIMVREEILQAGPDREWIVLRSQSVDETEIPGPSGESGVVVGVEERGNNARGAR